MGRQKKMATVGTKTKTGVRKASLHTVSGHTRICLSIVKRSARMSKPRCEKIICLSDSGESVRSASNDADKDDADFNFPPVDFTYHAASLATDTIDEPNVEVNEPPASLDRDSLSELLGKYCDKRETSRQADRKRKNKHRKTRGTSAESDPHDDDEKSVDNSPTPEAARNCRGTENRRKDSERSNFVGETRENSPTRAEKQYQTNMQPGEGLKSVSIAMDKGLKKFGFQSALDALRELDVSCKLDLLPVGNSIMWMRNSKGEIFSKTQSLAEKEILVVWNFDETVRKVKDGSFASSVESIATLVPDTKIILVLYGTKGYFQYQSNPTKQRSKNDRSIPFDNLPKISKGDLEICMAEVQLLVDCNSMLVDTLHDFNTLLCRLTKAIVERPIKLNKRQRLDDRIDWYATGDNRDTVRVDKNGNGLKRLWQHQLRQFNLASLEASEAISLVYPSPCKLMQVYGNCTLTEGEQLLSEILVRRAAGPLSTARKVGPDMSKKIFITFTSKDGDTLVNDR